MHRKISTCRVCGNAELVEVLDLGMQTANDVFPTVTTQRVAAAPLKLVKCTGDETVCGLLQLAHHHDACVSHGRTVCHTDSAQGWPSVRQDPLLCKIMKRFSSGAALMAEAAAADFARYIEPAAGSLYEAAMRPPLQDGRVIMTSLSVLSSQERPLEFLGQVREALDRQRVCVIQERYMPYLLQRNSYDSIRHQIVAYYALKQIRWMAQKVGLRIIEIEMNRAGAGIAAIALARQESPYESSSDVESLLDEEAREGLHTSYPYECFAKRVMTGLTLLREFLDRAREAGKSVCALGASKSGNVILQCCHATAADIDKVGETDSRKVGAFTPGTLLPIVYEEEVVESKPDFLLVLPWHLRGTFLAKSRLAGCNLLFPLPKLEVVRAGL